MRYANYFACLIAMCGGLASAADNHAATFSEASVRASMGLPPDAKVRYAAEDGTALTFAEFTKRMTPGMSVMMIKDEKSHDLTLRLQSAAATAKQAAEAAKTAKAITVPPINLVDLSGRPVRDADLHGRPTLLSFFFDACVPCIREVPILNAFKAKHPEFNYLAVTFDSAAAAKAFVAKHSLSWPVVADAKAFIHSSGVTGYPTYLLTDANGKLLGNGSGMDQRAMADTAFGLKTFEAWVAQKRAAK